MCFDCTVLSFSLPLNCLCCVAVCIAVVEKFANTLAPDVKSDTKKIEAEFRKFCKTTKSKENRFVSIRYKISFYKACSVNDVPHLVTFMLIKHFLLW
jgi:hypothetical protein